MEKFKKRSKSLPGALRWTWQEMDRPLRAGKLPREKEHEMEITGKAREVALALWQEQLSLGLGPGGEVATHETVDDWLSNRSSEEVSDLEEAAEGDPAATIRIRRACGLPALV